MRTTINIQWPLLLHTFTFQLVDFHQATVFSITLRQSKIQQMTDMTRTLTVFMLVPVRNFKIISCQFALNNQVLDHANTWVMKENYKTASWYFSFTQSDSRFDVITITYLLITNTPDAIKYFISYASLQEPNCMANYSQTYQVNYTDDSWRVEMTGLCPLSVYNISVTVSRDGYESVTKYQSFLTGTKPSNSLLFKSIIAMNNLNVLFNYKIMKTLIVNWQLLWLLEIRQLFPGLYLKCMLTPMR